MMLSITATMRKRKSLRHISSRVGGPHEGFRFLGQAVSFQLRNPNSRTEIFPRIGGLDLNGAPDFDALHSRVNDKAASACAFELLMLNGDDLRHMPQQRCGRFSGTVAEFNTSSTLKAMATNYTLPPASSDLRALFQRSSTRPIARGRRELGSRSRTRTRLLQC